MRDIGLMGESFFQVWCSSVGLIANSSRIDKTGWDFFVEFPCKQKVGIPEDMLPAPIECKIQVKSTDKRDRKLPIAVSNLNRLVKAQMPTFFCFIEFDNKDEPQAAYLVHVGKEIIEKTLKRIRELESQGNSNQLNKHKITIHYCDNDRLADTTGTSLKLAIEKYIPDTIEKYIEEKNKLLKTLGFEDGIARCTITVSGDDPIKDLVDMTLGLRKEVYMDKSISYHSRFGILSNNSFMNYEGGILSIQTKPSQIKVKFKEYAFSSGITFNAEMYTSPFFKFVPEEYIKLRIKSRLFDLLIEPFNKKISWSFHTSYDERSPLEELRNLFKIFNISQKSSSPLIVEIESEDLPSSKILELQPEDFSPFLPKLIIGNEVYECYKIIYPIAEIAVSICQKSYLSEDTVLVSIEDLIRLSMSLDTFHQILYAVPETVQFELTLEGEEYQQNTKAVCIFSTKTNIGNHNISCFCGIVGYLTLIDQNQYRLINDDVADSMIIGEPLVLIETEVIDQEIFNKKFDEFETELQKKGLLVLRLES
ncbi:hypothetical protein A6770_26570 [Nostoc minutum NIES-26]|uniref:DUF4365 domain-containing protein n=1 Tax=Nostoc minutum NIES-26 TaxID=1844469 RepID=A0A367QQU8_9NOSO|nr:hypothetical protein A6770_26570 [Nostoc minutum NIES-26]